MVLKRGEIEKYYKNPFRKEEEPEQKWRYENE
jgi:hypothetical protein